MGVIIFETHCINRSLIEFHGRSLFRFPRIVSSEFRGLSFFRVQWTDLSDFRGRSLTAFGRRPSQSLKDDLFITISRSGLSNFRSEFHGRAIFEFEDPLVILRVKLTVKLSRVNFLDKLCELSTSLWSRVSIGTQNSAPTDMGQAIAAALSNPF